MKSLKFVQVTFGTIWFLIVTLYLDQSSYAQKRNITYETHKEWCEVSGGGISRDGNFIYYLVENMPVGRRTVILKSQDPNWSLEFVGLSSPKITEDNRYFVGQLDDTIVIVNLKTRFIKKIGEINEFRVIKQKEKELLSYITTKKRTLIISSFKDGNSIYIPNVQQYQVSPNGEILVAKQIEEREGKQLEDLLLVNINVNRRKVIFVGGNSNNYKFDSESKQLAFLNSSMDENSIWYYNSELDTATMLLNNSSSKIGKQYKIGGNTLDFSSDNKGIFFSIIEVEKMNDREQEGNLEIWSYQDRYLRSQANTAYGFNARRSYISILNIANSEVTRLTKENERISLNTFSNNNDSIFVLENSFGNIHETFMPTSKISYSLCLTKTGKQILLDTARDNILTYFSFSPRRSSIVYYDSKYINYFSYNIKTGQKIKITENINDGLLRYNRLDYTRPQDFPIGIVGWMDDDRHLIILSTFNLWLVDSRGINQPLKLFKPTNNERLTFQKLINKPTSIFKNNSNVIIYGFNIDTKQVSFYSLKLNKRPELKKISEGPYYFKGIENLYSPIINNEVITSLDNKTYLLLLQSVDKAPNYYVTNDLKSFKQISNIEPQKTFNWLSSELHTYLDSSNVKYQGILYKPENFDPQKKYPILFMYYERQSNLLNIFPNVNPAAANFNIPMAVSAGYLVFLPDMVTKIGHSADGALESILNAVKHLSQYSWIDTAKMGIAGHSFGGFETNYIITHTNIFKAAVSGAGNSELISMPYELWGLGDSKQNYYLNSSVKMGSLLLDDPRLYIESSPIFNVKRITTPLLILHNSDDKSVPVRQSRQLFILMRSYQKVVWWLNYKGEGHLLLNEENLESYNKKVLEFFDYFLKGKPKPQWMYYHI